MEILRAVWQGVWEFARQTWALSCLFGQCAILPAAIGLAYYYFGIRPVNAHIAQLAAQMGFSPVDPRRGRRFGGVYRGRPVDVGYGLRLGYGYAGRNRYSPALSVQVELDTRAPLHGSTGCNDGPVGPNATFEQAFHSLWREPVVEGLSADAREAMLAFVRKHSNLWLEGQPTQSAAPQPAARDRLKHTLADVTGTSPEILRSVLDDMVAAAREIERG